LLERGLTLLLVFEFRDDALRLAEIFLMQPFEDGLRARHLPAIAVVALDQ
jgi:hypothetical protein